MNKRNYSSVLVVLFFGFALAIIYGIYYQALKQADTKDYFSEYNKVLKNELKDQLDKQEQIDDKLLDILNNGGYTLENPCVLKDPYGISPLSAIVIFNSDKETSIKVSINDKEVTTVASSKDHMIPIYGLYANSKNIVKLTNDKGGYTEFIIETDVLDDNIGNIKLAPQMKNKKHIFMLGPTNSADSMLRAFDTNKNLMFYLKFGNISKASILRNTIQVTYTSNIKDVEEEKSIKLELDYLGRIVGIYKTIDDIDENIKVKDGKNEYVLTPYNLYKKEIKNYEIKKVSDVTTTTTPIKIKSSEIKDRLVSANIYKNEYYIVTDGSFITYDFYGKDVKLILTSKKNDMSYLFDLTNGKPIYTNLKGEYSAYIITNGTYYTLLTTITL